MLNKFEIAFSAHPCTKYEQKMQLHLGMTVVKFFLVNMSVTHALALSSHLPLLRQLCKKTVLVDNQKVRY